MVDIITEYWHTYVVDTTSPLGRIYYDDTNAYKFHKEYDDLVAGVVDAYFDKVSKMCKDYTITPGMLMDAEKEYYEKKRQITGTTWSDAQYSSKAFQVVYITRKIIRRIIMVLQICRDAHRYGILKQFEHTLFVVGGGPCFEGAIYSAYMKEKCNVDVLTVNFDKNNWEHVTICDKFVCELFDTSLVTDKDEIFTSYVLEHHVSLNIPEYVKRGINVYSIEKEYFKRCHQYKVLGDSRMKDTSKVVFCNWKYDPRKCIVSIPAIIIKKETCDSRNYKFVVVTRPHQEKKKNEVVESCERLQVYPRHTILCVGDTKVMTDFVRKYKLVGYVIATRNTLCQALAAVEDNSLNTVIMSDVISRSQSVELTHIMELLREKMSLRCTLIIIDYICDAREIDKLQYKNMVNCAGTGATYKYFLKNIRYYRPFDDIDAMLASYGCDKRCVSFTSMQSRNRYTLMYEFTERTSCGSVCDGISGLVGQDKLYVYAARCHQIKVPDDKQLYEYHRLEVFK